MKRILILCILFLFFWLSNGCVSNDEPENWNEFKVYYFDFDEVEHYKNHISEDSLSEIRAVNFFQSKTKRFLSIIEGDTPMELSDSLFVNELESFGYEYRKISESKHENLNEVFREKSANRTMETFMCLPVYNDILVFKKDNKVTGVTKICFMCQQIYFVGTAADTRNFQTLNAFHKLREVLTD